MQVLIWGDDKILKLTPYFIYFDNELTYKNISYASITFKTFGRQLVYYIQNKNLYN